MTPRTFKTMSAARHFMSERPGRPWHLTINHGNECAPSQCVCRPTLLVQEMTPQLQADIDARVAASAAANP